MNSERKITKAGLTDWLEAAQEVDESSAFKLETLLKDNAARQERLKAFGLRGVPTWGPSESLHEVVEQIPQQVIESPESIFFINCVPKRKGENLKREREFALRWDELLQFAHAVPDGIENYYVEIRQDFTPEYSGNIISDGEGHVVLEWATRRHSAMEHKSLGEIKKGELNTGTQMAFRYEGEPTAEEVQVALGALQKLSPELSRQALEQLNIYSEWSFSREQGYWFFEAISEKGRQNKFWTELNREQ